MANPIIKYFSPFIHKQFENANEIILDANKSFTLLCKENKNDAKKFKKLTIGNLFPIVSIYKSLLKHDIPKQEALKFMDEVNFSRSVKTGKSCSHLLHLFGLYKLYPWMFKKLPMLLLTKIWVLIQNLYVQIKSNANLI